MASNLLSRYIWLVDTILRYGPISRARINRLWQQSAVGDGAPIPRRTFYNYRNAIEELFKVEIVCNTSTNEYTIKGADRTRGASFTDWLLNSASLTSTISNLSAVSDRVFLEEVPSARLYLNPMTDAMRKNHPVKFNYHPYTRINPTNGVVINPYFLKIFRQRWYVTGFNRADMRIKTYALDRITDLTILDNQTFELPAGFDAEAFVSDAFGVVFTQGKTYTIMLRTTPRRAKYLRALPLHHSQSEFIHNDYSIFQYKMRLTPDLVQELMSMGSDITVMNPPELRAMVRNALTDTLANY